MGTVEFPSSIHVRRRSGRVRAVYIMKIRIQNDGGDEEMAIKADFLKFTEDIPQRVTYHSFLKLAPRQYMYSHPHLHQNYVLTLMPSVVCRREDLYSFDLLDVHKTRNLVLESIHHEC